MTPGCEGALPPVIESVLAVPVPHAFTAATDMVPPDVVVFTVMELVVEVPDQPAGNVQT